jgi:hypothetical protein
VFAYDSDAAGCSTVGIQSGVDPDLPSFEQAVPQASFRASGLAAAQQHKNQACGWLMIKTWTGDPLFRSCCSFIMLVAGPILLVVDGPGFFDRIATGLILLLLGSSIITVFLRARMKAEKDQQRKVKFPITKLQSGLSELARRGFNDRTLNPVLLEQCDYDMEKVLDRLADTSGQVNHGNGFL